METSKANSLNQVGLFHMEQSDLLQEGFCLFVKRNTKADDICRCHFHADLELHALILSTFLSG